MKGSTVVCELDAAGVAEARDEPVVLHRAREPRELLAADEVERAGPQRFLERSLAPVERLRRGFRARRAALRKPCFAFLAGDAR